MPSPPAPLPLAEGQRSRGEGNQPRSLIARSRGMIRSG